MGGAPLSERWQPKVEFKGLDALGTQYIQAKAPADGAEEKASATAPADGEEVGQLAQPLVTYVQEERKRKALELRRRDNEITAEHKLLLEMYEKDEIQEKGDNPCQARAHATHATLLAVAHATQLCPSHSACPALPCPALPCPAHI